MADKPTVDLLVVAGGAARRLGGTDKAMLVRPDGRTVLAALLAARAEGRRIVVGPERDVTGVDVWAREEPPGGGPVAAIAAGLPHVDAPRVVVVAGDLPHGADAVGPLLAALGGHDAAVVEADGHPQWLLAAWRTAALRASLARLDSVAGARAGALYAGFDVVRVDDPGAQGRSGARGGSGAFWSGDLDTPADVRRLLG